MIVQSAERRKPKCERIIMNKLGQRGCYKSKLIRPPIEGCRGPGSHSTGGPRETGTKANVLFFLILKACPQDQSVCLGELCLLVVVLPEKIAGVDRNFLENPFREPFYRTFLENLFREPFYDAAFDALGQLMLADCSHRRESCPLAILGQGPEKNIQNLQQNRLKRCDNSVKA